VHPLRVESVAWVAERKDVLSGLFFLLTLMAYVRYARLPWSPRRYALVFFLFAAGLMAKPMLVTLPLVLLLLDYWPLGRWEVRAGEPVFGGNSWRIPRRLIMEKIPLLVLAAFSCVITVVAQQEAIGSFERITLPLRLSNAVHACVLYLKQMTYPAALSVFYPYPFQGVQGGLLFLSSVLLVLISVVSWRERRRHPFLLMGWLWYLAMLLPVIGIVQVGAQAHADRYTYLPQIGLVVAGVWLAAEGLAARRLGKAMGAAIFLAAILGLGFLARHQVSFWRNSEVLWTRALACTSGNFMAHNNLGNVFQTEGRWEEALLHYKKSLEINPAPANAYNNMAAVLSRMGWTGEAITYYKKALEINPREVFLKNNLAWILATSPDPALRNGVQAVELAEEAERLSDDPHPNLLGTLSAAYAEAGRFSDAIRTVEKAIALARGTGRNTAPYEQQRLLYESGRPFRETSSTP
jgi:Tfp pilus assembly protein PilF